MKMIEKFLNWLDDYQHRRRIHQFALYWHSQGAACPYSMAAEEDYLRLKLEQFREFASQRYLEDQSLTQSAIKQEWLDLVVKPMSKSRHTVDSAKLLRGAIQVMGDEMFVREAKRLRREEIQNAVDAARAAAPQNRKEMREQAFRRQ